MNGPFPIRKRPETAEAIRYDGSNGAEVVAWANGTAYIDDDGLVIRTDRGETLAQPGDFIIRGLVGEVYPCTPAAFGYGWELA